MKYSEGDVLYILNPPNSNVDILLVVIKDIIHEYRTTKYMLEDMYHKEYNIYAEHMISNICMTYDQLRIYVVNIGREGYPFNKYLELFVYLDRLENPEYYV